MEPVDSLPCSQDPPLVPALSRIHLNIIFTFYKDPRHSEVQISFPFSVAWTVPHKLSRPKSLCIISMTSWFWWGLVRPRPNRKQEDHPLSAIRDCLYSSYPPHLATVSMSSLSTRHAMETRDPVHSQSVTLLWINEHAAMPWCQRPLLLVLPRAKGEPKSKQSKKLSVRIPMIPWRFYRRC
jgi:hypothetical protein